MIDDMEHLTWSRPESEYTHLQFFLMALLFNNGGELEVPEKTYKMARDLMQGRQGRLNYYKDDDGYIVSYSSDHS